MTYLKVTLTHIKATCHYRLKTSKITCRTKLVENKNANTTSSSSSLKSNNHQIINFQGQPAEIGKIAKAGWQLTTTRN